MNYTVVYTASALQQLAAIWTTASDRSVVTTASNRLDADLANDPLNVGESRVGNTRIAHELPLAIYFDVESTKAHVRVWAVWRV